MKKLSKVGLALLILAATAGASALLVKFRPEAEKEPLATVIPTVVAATATPENIQLTIPSQGIIEPVTKTEAAAEVSGRIVFVSPAFKAGESFKKGDVLLKIDPTNFESAMRQAEAVLADAVLNQEVEKARVEQALVDWNRVGRKAKPTELLLRRPYLASAEAKVKSARAAVEKAVADLERTRLTALYDGRIKSTHTDLGSFAAPGTLLAELYATGTLEIRLPVSLDDYAFIDRIQSGERSPTVKLNSLIAGTSYEWDAVIVRTEGQVDHANRSIYLVANLDTKALARKFDTIDIDLIINGLFVNAQIEGTVLKGVYNIPRKAFYRPGTLVIIDDENRLRFREVRVLRSNARNLIVAADSLEPGTRICLTALEQVIDGMQVEIAPGATVLPKLATEDPPLDETVGTRP